MPGGIKHALELIEEDGAVISIISLSPRTEASIEYVPK
jgi:hypothetical protein